MQKANFSFEIIIADDCSTDGTRKIIEEYEKKYPDIIKPIYQEKNVGGNRNAYEFMYPALTAKYIAVCEGDDFWTDPYKLQKQIDFLEQHPDLAITFHRVNSVDKDNNVLDTQETGKEIKYYNAHQVHHTFIPTLSAVFRNSVKKIPDEMMRVYSGDVFIFALLACHGGAADLGFVGASYRKHSGGIFTGIGTFKQYQRSLITRKIMMSCNYFNKEHKNSIRKEFKTRKRRYIKYFLKRGEFSHFWSILFI
jgi:glycosyltransferase involved in cell wall biosynthesis